MKQTIFELMVVAVLVTAFVPDMQRASAAEPYLMPADFGSSVNQLVSSEKGDFAHCLRDLFLKFRLHIDQRDIGWAKDEMSSYGWEVKEFGDSFDVCFKRDTRFGDIRRPVSLHAKITKDHWGSCATLSVSIKCEMSKIPVDAARRIFKPASAWAELMASEDVQNRAKGRNLAVSLEIAYLNVCGGWGKRLDYFGYDFSMTFQRDTAKLDQITLDYRAASGLDPAIDRATGTLYPRSSRLIDKFPPNESGTPPGDEIIANGKAHLFRFQGAAFAQDN